MVNRKNIQFLCTIFIDFGNGRGMEPNGFDDGFWIVNCIGLDGVGGLREEIGVGKVLFFYWFDGLNLVQSLQKLVIYGHFCALNRML